jgi:hypothetical protein
VLEAFAVNDMKNFASGDVKHSRESAARISARATCREKAFLAVEEFANSFHLAIRQFASWGVSPRCLECVGKWLAAFCDRILMIVFVGSEKKVIGPDARRIIAAMANFHSRGDVFVVMKHPGTSMRRSVARLTVSCVVNAGSPKPAMERCFLNVSPEILFGCFAHGGSVSR